MAITADRRTFSAWVWLERLWQDLRYGCRMLAASPGFTSIAVLSLAIGIGANCAIFSFADALLLRPLPVARPGEVLTVGSTASLEALGASSLVSSYRDYVDIRDRNKSFDGLAAFTYVTAGFATDPRATPKLKMGMLVSANLFPLMGVEPTIGRAFRPEEDQVPGRDARRRARPDDVGAGIRIRPGCARPDRANQRRRVHRDWRGHRRIQGHGPVRALGFLRAADDVRAPDDRSEGLDRSKRATPGTSG